MHSSIDTEDSEEWSQGEKILKGKAGTRCKKNVCKLLLLLRIHTQFKYFQSHSGEAAAAGVKGLCAKVPGIADSAWERRRSVLTLREIVLHKHRIPA